MPRYRSSPWTTARELPLEAVLTDEGLAALLGCDSDALSSDYLTTLDQAMAWARRHQRRAASRRVKVTRADTLAELGQTVELVIPEHGLAHRCLITALDRSREGAAATLTATLELPL